MREREEKEQRAGRAAKGYGTGKERKKMFDAKMTVPKAPLYQEEFEHDNCGIGACVNIKGKKSHETVENALKIVENLEHRAGKDAEG